MKLVLAAAIGLSALAAAPSTGATYDAFTSFTGTLSNGAFSYGSYNGTTYTPYSTGVSCDIIGTICLTSGNYLGVFKTASGAAFQSGTIAVPDDALIFHPGQTGEYTTLFFTAPTTAVYSVTLHAAQADTANPNAVDLIGINGAYPSIFSFTTLTTSSPTYTFTQGGILLGAGQSIGFAVGSAGNYQFDATKVSFSVSSAPEPASWALMIAGFGLVGVSLRRRALAAA